MTDQKVRQLRADTRTEDAEIPGTLFAALARFQADLPRIVKGNTAKVPGKDGKQGYSYDYADLADVSDAVLKRLGALGLFFTALPRHREEDGKFGLAYTLGHVSGEREDGWWELRSDLPMQQMGGMITYARRYVLLAVTGAHPDGEDDDAASSQHVASRKSAGDAWDEASPAPPRRDDGPYRRLLAAADAFTTSAGADQVTRDASTAKDQRLINRDQCDHIQNRVRARVDALSKNARPVAVEDLAQAAQERPVAAVPDEQPASGPAAATGPDTPGTATTPQIGAIWTVLSTVFKFGKDEKDQARAVCGYITRHALGSTRDMSKNEAKTVLDTLASWRETAEEHGEQPHEFLIELMATAENGGTDG